MVPRILCLLLAPIAVGCDSAKEVRPSERSARAPVSSRQAEVGAPTVEVEVPSSDRPVTVGGSIYPRSASPGSRLSVIVEIHTAPTWHVYPTTGVDGFAPTRLELRLPGEVEAASDWRGPAATPAPGTPHRVHSGQVRFERDLIVARDAEPGERLLECRVSYQACDPFFCRPPETQMLPLPLTIE